MKSPAPKALTSVFLILSFFAQNSFAEETRDTVRIGVFFESIYDLDFANYAYSANFWMWSVVKGDVNGDGVINEEDSLAAMDRISLVEVSNAKDYTFSHQSASRVVSKGNVYWWAQQFCKASIYQKWKLDNYPFDKQRLALRFESSSFDTSQVIMLNEQDSLTFKKDINVIGWEIKRSKIYSHTITYNTDFGDPNGNGTSAFSRVSFVIELKRIGADAFFMKLCLGVFIAFMVAMIVFAISPTSMDSRFGLGIGALFAVAANKYVVDSNIPQTATNCLVDKVHEITFVYILFTVIASVISLKLHEGNKQDKRKAFDIAAGVILLLSYCALLLWYFIQAHDTTPFTIASFKTS